MKNERVRLLDEKEIEEIKEHYILISDMAINKVSLLEYKRVKEYLINDTYFLRDYGKDSILLCKA